MVSNVTGVAGLPEEASCAADVDSNGVINVGVSTIRAKNKKERERERKRGRKPSPSTNVGAWACSAGLSTFELWLYARQDIIAMMSTIVG